LKIKKYKHNFKNIKKYEVNGICYDDSVLGCQLHNVRKTIEKSKYEISDVLPQCIIKRYENLTFDNLLYI
jgi:hypothetical protein